MGRWVYGQVGRWADGLMDRWAGGLMNRWVGGLMDTGQLACSLRSSEGTADKERTNLSADFRSHSVRPSVTSRRPRTCHKKKHVGMRIRPEGIGV